MSLDGDREFDLRLSFQELAILKAGTVDLDGDGATDDLKELRLALEGEDITAPVQSLCKKIRALVWPELVEHRQAEEDENGPRHIRNERATRERWPQFAGNELPRGLATAWCGANANGHWFFQDLDHAVLELKHGGGIAACPACLRAAREIINAELACKVSGTREKRFFEVDVAGCVSYTIVAELPDDAWRYFGETVRDTGCGQDMLDDEVVMSEIDQVAAAGKSMVDGDRNIKLVDAEIGAVFCSEF